MPFWSSKKPWQTPDQSDEDFERARKTYDPIATGSNGNSGSSTSLVDDILYLLFIGCVIGGVISLVLAPFTGITVVTAAAFFVCAWFLHKLLGGDHMLKQNKKKSGWKRLWVVGLVTLCLVCLWLLLTQYSLEESRYKCEGSLTTPSGAVTQQMYLKVEKYRPWIFWADGNWGVLHYELPQKYVDVFFDVRLVGDQLQVAGHGGGTQGNFSTLSKTIAISTPHGFYDGRCEKTN